jgi:hypothetical protein
MTTIFSGKKIPTLKRYHCTDEKKGSPMSENHFYIKEGSVDISEQSSNNGQEIGSNSMKGRSTVVRTTEKVDMSEGSNYRKSSIHSKDRPSLFQFGNDNGDVNDQPKRRSNSLGKENINEEEKCKRQIIILHRNSLL